MERDGWKSILINKIHEMWCVESIILFKLLKEFSLLKVDLYLRESQVGNFEIRIILLNHILKHLPHDSKILQLLA